APPPGDGGLDAPPGAHPHPLYPPLDLDTLPGAGGANDAPYQVPSLPTTTRTVTIASTGAQAGADLFAACQVPGSAVTVPDAAGHLGTVFIGDATDCDITLGPAVVINILYLGHVNTPAIAPVHRIRVRGGQLGQLLVDPGSTDLVLDGVAINTAVVTPALRAPTAIFLIRDRKNVQPPVDRFAVVNSFVRVAAGEAVGGATDGSAYLGESASNVFFANDNVVTAGNRNSWGFLVGGGHNELFVDLTVRVSIDKLVRLEDAPIDYVYVRGGTWMREDTHTMAGGSTDDSFVQRDDKGTDHVFLHDAAVWLLPPVAPTFGASSGPGEAGKHWEARRLAWHARSADIVSDALLTGYQDHCPPTAVCDYGVGTHTYTYDANLALPASPWRDLPSFADDDPDHLPVTP
ncbi:MAG TPA: hypothetical protein VHE35_26895, partial [Kofleriaceae bacterium]|nr:hypothetical protein [Kofleriaceae bacterium]